MGVSSTHQERLLMREARLDAGKQELGRIGHRHDHASRRVDRRKAGEVRRDELVQERTAVGREGVQEVSYIYEYGSPHTTAQEDTRCRTHGGRAGTSDGSGAGWWWG